MYYWKVRDQGSNFHKALPRLRLFITASNAKKRLLNFGLIPLRNELTCEFQ